MYGNETDKVQGLPEKVEKFSIRVTGMVTPTTSERMQSHYKRMVDNRSGNGAVLFSDVLRDLLDKGLEVAEKEVQDV